MCQTPLFLIIYQINFVIKSLHLSLFVYYCRSIVTQRSYYTILNATIHFMIKKKVLFKEVMPIRTGFKSFLDSEFSACFSSSIECKFSFLTGSIFITGFLNRFVQLLNFANIIICYLSFLLSSTIFIQNPHFLEFLEVLTLRA